MNLVRGGSSGAVGVLSGVLKAQNKSFELLGQTVDYAMALEALAVIAGVGMQAFSPYTAPQVVDGVLDGALALIGQRVGEELSAQVAPATSPYRVAARVAPALGAGGRAYIGSITTSTPKRVLQ